MTWFRQPSRWRDAECLSALSLLCLLALAVCRARLPACCAPRCLLKTWTGVPCMTCGGSRALAALLQGRVETALRLQPLLTLLALAAVAWASYAVAGACLGVPRVRVRAARGEKILLLAVVLLLALGNWVYLIVDGR